MVDVKKKTKMIWVGLTGGLGSGKSTVADILTQMGWPVISADRLARKIVEVGEPVLAQIVDSFGPQILKADGTLDRQKLGQVVFSDPELRKRLEGITHPAIQKLVLAEKANAEAQKKPMAFYDVPLLFEAGLQDQFDILVVVACSWENQIQRSMLRDGLSYEQVVSRLQAQWPMAKKIEQADQVFYNDGTQEQLREQVETWLASLALPSPTVTES